MTSIPLSSLPVTDEIRRDRWGRYMCKAPGGDKPIPHTRVTTAAKSLDNGGALAPWKATMGIVGTIMRRGLRAQWEALLAEHPNPWYGGQAAKAECKRLVEECAAAGGADERKDIGVSLHAITAVHDLGRTPTHLTVETERDLAAYIKVLDHAGVEIVPGMVEITVVLDDWQVAGTFDRLVTVPGFDLPLIADLKCGKDLSYSWSSIAVQLSAYSRADAIYVQGPAEDGSEDRRLPMPAVDQANGLVIWVDSGTGIAELHLIDLVSGWQGFELSMGAREWRKRTVAMPWGAGRFGDQLVSELEASVVALAEGVEQVDVDLGLIDEVPKSSLTTQQIIGRQSEFPGTLFEPTSVSLAAEVRDWLQRRIDVIGAHANAKLDLTRSWPHESVDGQSVPLPTLIRFADHTPAQLEAIEVVLGQVERRHRIPWPEPRPGVDLMAQVLNMFPGSTEVTNTKEK